MTIQLVNDVTAQLKPYPMEELSRIRGALVKAGKPVFDFGTGDPKIPTWSPIRDAIIKAIPQISQYPSVKGSDALRDAQWSYLTRRFGIARTNDIGIIPSQGSKEAIFNIALCLVGRSGGKKHLIYPDPGYPVYRSSAQFAGGIPYPVRVSEADGYLLKPWTLPENVQKSAAAIWVNHPHNPTGATANYQYWQELIAWCHKTDTVLLSDDCYVDIYDTKLDQNINVDPQFDSRPLTPLMFTSDRVLTFMSLSKRSGLTGYRSGMIAGDHRIVSSLLQARANFGVGSPDFIQAGSVVAWSDDDHVAERRKIFSHRLKLATPHLQNLGLIDNIPEATFYLWCRVPKSFKNDDVGFILKLAELGIITSPSSWLSEGIGGYFRLALVPGDDDTLHAMDLMTKFIKSVN
ncbi:MAG: aminotransferase class I/II-fold pyridoxal phosphate-dependent enzyme [Proteobacteria bacterium]|nr:aminotransferase class I/II-fold pyridoxal phosphate-dependent enzyme [Pseudomonadota bacterium]